jgi:serine/threonine protein kinase
MAPEIHHTLTDKDKYYDTDKSDIFALGVILFALLLGKLPFEFAVEENKLYQLIKEKKYDDFWKFHHQIKEVSHQEGFRGEEFQELFERMVSWDANERPTAS